MCTERKSDASVHLLLQCLGHSSALQKALNNERLNYPFYQSAMRSGLGRGNGGEVGHD